MAVAEANALVNLITKATAFAQQTALDWYKTSQAMKLFPVRLAVLNQQSNNWTSLLNRYGMSADPFIGPVLELAVQLLDQEELQLQKLQQNCCCRVGRRLLFPESLIGALNSVITAFETLPEMISQQAERTQQLEKASLCRVARLPFLPDRKYVPLEASIRAVRMALERVNTGPIVVVSGGPGQGKSSMARYLACLYQDGVDPLDTTQGGQGQTQGTQIAPASKRFVDGVFFLRCGKKADCKSLLMQLWQDLGYQALPTSAGQGEASSAVEIAFALQSEDAMHKQLSARLANQMVLIILDDVWDSMIVDRLLVQQQGIQYLITTQRPGLWTDAVCVEIPISLPTSQQANQILANHVKGFPQEVTSDIQDQINQIIDKSASNPLVLANVATNIGVGKASQLQEWESTLRYLSDLQNGDDQRPVTLFGRTYSKRTMGASIEMALSSFSSEEQTLLLLASVFESELVPEVVFKTLFKIIHSSLAKFSRCCEHMETINFIQIDSPTDPRRRDNPQRSWSLHTMRQNFISQIKEEEIAMMFSKLMEYITNDNVAAILLVLYGQESWRNKAASTLGIPVNQFVNDTDKLGISTLSSIRTFVWLLNADGEEEWQKKSHQATKKILEEYLLLGELNQKKIIELLFMQETISGACQALLQFTLIIQRPLFKESNDQILPALMAVLQQTKSDFRPQLREVLYLFQGLSFHNVGDAVKIGSHSGAVERLIELLVDAVGQDIQCETARTLGYLSQNIVENATKIVSYPGAVEKLVALLGEGLSPHAQGSAAWAIGNMSKDLENATKIGSYLGAVERLVGLLGGGVNPDVQKQAIWALGYISNNVVENATKIGSYPGAMERLVGLFEEGVKPDVQQQAAWALGSLSKDVVVNATKIGSYSRAVERLVGLLGGGVNPDVQQQAAWALGYISNNVVENATKIGSYPGAVERLVGLLEEGVKPDVQQQAAWALGSLSKDVVVNATKIGSYSRAVERLVGLLGGGVNPDVQKQAAWALGYISNNVVKNATKIGSYPGAVERLVGLLEEGVKPDVQQQAAWALGSLSKDVVVNATKIGSYSRAVERLVGLLGGGVNPDVQKQAAWALGYISNNVVENATKIGSYPGAVERLVGLLEEGVKPDVQEQAAWALGSLSKDVVVNAIKIGCYTGAMGRLVGLLGEGVSPAVRMNVTLALWYICCALVQNKSYLRKALLDDAPALESLRVLTCSNKHQDWHFQYWSAQAYEFATNGNEEERVYLSSTAYEGKVDALVSMGDYKGALEAYDNALAIEMVGRLVSARCFVKAMLGDFEWALRDANGFIELAGDRSLGLQERGVLKRMMGDLNGALVDLNEALELETDDYEMVKHRGLVKFLLKDEDGARADAEWALRIKPPGVESYQYGRSPCLGTSSVEYLGYKLK